MLKEMILLTDQNESKSKSVHFHNQCDQQLRLLSNHLHSY